MSTSSQEKIEFKIIAGQKNITAVVTINIEPDPGSPTTFVVNYAENGVVPTGNNVRVYRVGQSIVEIPILGTPVLDTVQRLLIVVVPPGYVLLDPTYKYIVEFEVEQLI